MGEYKGIAGKTLHILEPRHELYAEPQRICLDLAMNRKALIPAGNIILEIFL
jgi:hypothetical protein